MFVWNPKTESYVYNSGQYKYYCNKCKHIHYFDSKKGKEHIEYGQYPKFPFLPGNLIINIPKNKKVMD